MNGGALFGLTGKAGALSRVWLRALGWLHKAVKRVVARLLFEAGNFCVLCGIRCNKAVNYLLLLVKVFVAHVRLSRHIPIILLMKFRYRVLIFLVECRY